MRIFADPLVFLLHLYATNGSVRHNPKEETTTSQLRSRFYLFCVFMNRKWKHEAKLQHFSFSYCHHNHNSIRYSSYLPSDAPSDFHILREKPYSLVEDFFKLPRFCLCFVLLMIVTLRYVDDDSFHLPAPFCRISQAFHAKAEGCFSISPFYYMPFNEMRKREVKEENGSG